MEDHLDKAKENDPSIEEISPPEEILRGDLQVDTPLKEDLKEEVRSQEEALSKEEALFKEGL